MEIAPILWSWLATIIGSIAITSTTVIGYIKNLAQQGYKFNLEKINKEASESSLKISYLIFFIPILNLVSAMYLNKSLYKNTETWYQKGKIVPLNDKEKEILEDEPTLTNLLHINLNHELQKVGTIIYIDSNNQTNKIQFIEDDGIVTIEEAQGPDIEKKNKIEQRATLLQILNKEKQEAEYEVYKLILEEAIKENANEILLNDVESKDIELITKLIINYGNDIAIYISFSENITPEEEKENLRILSQTLKEMSGFDISFPEDQKQKILTK